MWQHFVAIGDSLTEGVGDPVDGIEFVGWVNHFVATIRQNHLNFRYTNLARRGLVTAEIKEQQLNQALALQPDLISVIAGGNDLLKGKWNAPQFEAHLAEMLERLSASSATVMTATMPDFLFLPVPPKMKERLTANLIEMNDIIRQLSRRFNTALGEGWNDPATKEAKFWSADGVHPNAYGYTHLARTMSNALHDWWINNERESQPQRYYATPCQGVRQLV